jgi:hypothetical protein
MVIGLIPLAVPQLPLDVTESHRAALVSDAVRACGQDAVVWLSDSDINYASDKNFRQ